LQFGYGSKNNTIDSNLFTDISSSAIEIGGATAMDSHPINPRYILSNHLITNNLIDGVAIEFSDAAGIFVGFTQYTTIKQNTIVNVPWSGIAMGWGWGLLDVGSFPGLPHATSGQWGFFDTPTPNIGCQILKNKIVNFINVLWDGGAIYTTGQQGPSSSNGLIIEGNVAYGKRTDGGSNVFYTDGGSRYISVRSNASYNNPIGITFYGPPPQIGDPYFFQYPPYYLQNNQPSMGVTLEDVSPMGTSIIQVIIGWKLRCRPISSPIITTITPCWAFIHTSEKALWRFALLHTMGSPTLLI
jgi:hypothetical protein